MIYIVNEGVFGEAHGCFMTHTGQQMIRLRARQKEFGFCREKKSNEGRILRSLSSRTYLPYSGSLPLDDSPELMISEPVGCWQSAIAPLVDEELVFRAEVRR